MDTNTRSVRFERTPGNEESEALVARSTPQRRSGRVSIELSNGLSVNQTDHGRNSSHTSRTGVYPGGLHDRRTSHWSIVSIKKEFREAEIEDIYESYWLRQQRAIVFKLLCILAAYSIALACLYLYTPKYRVDVNSLFKSYGHYEMISVFYLCSLMLAALLGCGLLLPQLYRKLYRILTLVIWFYLLSLMFVPLAFMPRTWAFDNATVAFGIIFITHTMLPTSRSVSTLLGVITMAANLVVVVVCYCIYGEEDKPFTTREFIGRVIADVLAYLGANLIGFYLKHFTDIQSRRMFLETGRFLTQTTRMERQIARQDYLRDRLLLKIIPRHLLDNRDMLFERLEKQDKENVALTRLMVTRHDDVSILYADIVSFTPLTANMEPNELVFTLNELFGRFDELAKRNNCLRIKILGDCYYCVSGLPDPTRHHAKNCVIMGLEMIKVIEHIRKETGVETLNMRIGIHTGWVLSGLIGDQKWQYDVWSDDVTLANHMESGGKPGKVHITEATLNKLHGEFSIEEGFGEERDEYLKSERVKTFFITDKELKNINIDEVLQRNNTTQNHLDESPQSSGARARIQAARRKTIHECIEHWGAETPFDSLSGDVIERTLLPEREEVKRKLRATFNMDKRERCCQVCCNVHQSAKGVEFSKMSQLTLKFKDKEIEKNYCSRKDENFPFYVTSTFVVFLIMSAVQLTFIRSVPLIVTIAVGVAVYTAIFLIVSSTQIADSLRSQSLLCEKFSNMGRNVMTVNELKILCSFVCSGLILAAAIIPVIFSDEKCESLDSNSTSSNLTRNLTTHQSSDLNTTDSTTDNTSCLYAPYFIFCCLVALVACNLFLRASYIFKTIYMSVCLAVENAIFYLMMDNVFNQYDSFMGPNAIPTKVMGSFHTALLFVILVVLDRQIESHMRMDFLHKTQTQQHQTDLDQDDDMKERILCNILPRPVASHFMDPGRDKQQLYHHRHANACVMFASIPGFKVFFSDVAVVGVDCLQHLNEIISGFDSLLKEHTGVEKIKTIGSSYMAATGLHSMSDTSEDEAIAVLNTKSMVEFAMAMMTILAKKNFDSFSNYSLRIGINHGSVKAGVVGAQKPVYDIWGDTVNVASRMESNGTPDQIQVPKATKELLEQGGVQCVYNTTKLIKGKPLPMDLYFVQKRQIEEDNYGH